MKCPCCGYKRTQTTNLGKRALAWGATAVTYAVLFPFTRGAAQGPARLAGRNICPIVNIYAWIVSGNLLEV